MANFQHFYLLHYSMAKSTHNAQIELAIADLNQQEIPKIMGTAKKFNLVESTLRRRWKGKTVSQHTASSLYKQRLTLAQEEQLIQQINTLTDRGLTPTSRMVRNLVKKTIRESVGKNWTGDFVRRYKDRFKSLYLRNINSQRIKSEYIPLFKLFYDLVIFISLLSFYQFNNSSILLIFNLIDLRN